ncbi:hypothetical protein ACFL1X_06750 [Candidatus Hydrogenedentota bacterium]
MAGFPRTTVGGISVSRLVIGTNWFLGYTHCTQAKSNFIKERFSDYRKIADIIEVFFRAGVDTTIGSVQLEQFRDGVREAEQRTGVKSIVMSTPSFKTGPRTPVDGFDPDEVECTLNIEAEGGATICLPHMNTTDKMVDECSRELRKMDQLCAAIRAHGMVPGLSTHLPQSIIYADETDLDVETYVSIFNSMGFLMPIEVDWVARMIQKAKKPVLTIKPLAAGQLRPLQGLTFSWNTVRDRDMVAVGTMTPGEAAEVIELSLSILERRQAEGELQTTRSKSSVTPKA